jgi:8-hydroxy-5-deazaflavin:NADPH oxidoreductase
MPPRDTWSSTTDIAIIGTGNVGQALGASFVRAGHAVTLAAQDADKTTRVAGTVGADVAASPAAAAAGADIVVIAVPWGPASGVAREIAGSVAGKVVVDATNPINADFTGLASDNGAQQLAALLPGARVVKAFNTLFASVQANPDAHGTTVDGLFATDDDAARATAAELIASIGLRPVHVGPLAAARELEALAWLNIRLNMIASGDWQSSYVLVGAPAAAVA